MFTMQTLFKVIVVALLIVPLSQARDDNKFDGYIKTDDCKVHILLLILLCILSFFIGEQSMCI